MTANKIRDCVHFEKIAHEILREREREREREIIIRTRAYISQFIDVFDKINSFMI